ncbi:ABC transporter permease [Neoasaia chiangmaiensis NBRC 101099]|nr:ABC-2 family transporter protein [Neoasaia chiangmaiensis]GBR39312.1 ABC transporter permease [Neoasaia chiangmaiensis NBRC 101099]GEN14519.1 ABC transporter permease [Neoasaia chiangmaiensis]
MLDGLTLYRRMAAASIKAQLRYPGTFAMQAAGNFVTTLLSFFGLWSLFRRFGSIAGWDLATVALLYGLVNVAFAVAETLGRGFEIFGGEYVKTGNFDRLLLRPRSTLLLLLGHELRLRPIGRFLQGAFVLGAGLWMAPHVSIQTLWLLPWAIAGGAAMFLGVLIGQAALCFVTVEGLEVVNVLTYGGVEAGQYPLPMFSRWLRRFLTWVLPLAGICYYPALLMVGHADPLGLPSWFGLFSPGMGFMFLIVMGWFWQRGVRGYVSSGS